MAWPRRKLGELADVSRGSSPRPIADARYFEGGTIPWIKIADATKSGKFLYETKEHVNEYGASFSRRLPPGTLLVAASGTLGYTQILGVEGCAHDGWLILQELRGLDRDFAYYTLKTVERHFFNSAYGAAIQNINTDILRETEIPYPPLPTQRKIAAVLSAYDELIENNTRRIKLLGKMAQALYREWFVRPCQSGKLPNGWEENKLCKLADINAVTIRRGQEPVEIDYVDISSVTSGCIEKVDHYAFADAPGRARRVVKHGDIIWSCVRPNRRSYALILNPQPNVIVSTGFAVITGKTAPYTYLYNALTTDEFVGYLTNHARGSAYPAVTSEDFENAKIALPPAALLDRFHANTAPQFDLIHNLHQKNANLRRTRDLLLPKLISGEVDVSELKIETGEPAA
jgi:type I restriction enzyme S subunit